MPDDPTNPEITLGDLDRSPSVIRHASSHVSAVDENMRASFARVCNEKDDLKANIEDLKRKIRTIEILDDLLEPCARRAFKYMYFYSAAVGVILIMSGFGCFKNKFDADVLKVLVGSTAVTVIGLVGMVLTGIFVGARRNSK